MPACLAWKPKSTHVRSASIRIRCLNPLSALQLRGYPVELFNPRRATRYAAVIYSRLYNEANYQEGAALQKRGVRIVFDLCDNHFYNPYGLEYRDKAAERLRRMMAMADHLVASTEALAAVMQAELATPRPITIIGDAVETEIRGDASSGWQRWLQSQKLAILLRRLMAARQHGRVPLVWFGNHGSPYADGGGMLDLLKVRTLLEDLNRRYPLSLTIISNSRKKYHQAIRPWSIPTYYLPWYADTFLHALRAHTIAIIPIHNNTFTYCKSNNRLALSLQSGLAVVADTIPSYLPFAQACYLNAWKEGLVNYLTNPELRQRHIAMGRAIIAKEWSLSRIADQWRKFFDMLLTEKQNDVKSLEY